MFEWFFIALLVLAGSLWGFWPVMITVVVFCVVLLILEACSDD